MSGETKKIRAEKLKNLIINPIARINQAVLLIEKSILILLMVGMLIFGFLQVFSRFILQAPIDWSEELLIYSFTFASFIGASMAIYTNSHFSVDLLMKNMPVKVVKAVRIFVWSVIIGFSLFILVYGWKLTKHNSIQRMNILPLSMTWAYITIPISGLFIFIHGIEKLLEIILDIERKSEIDDEDEHFGTAQKDLET